MKAAQIKNKCKLEIINLPIPKIDKKNNVLIKIKAVGICGSDIGIYNNEISTVKYPIIIGHELIGIVKEIGSNVKNLKIGDRVIINQIINCNNCDFCKNGHHNLCDNILVRGVYTDGGCCEYIVVREEDCFIIPNKISDIDAVMIEPLTIALQACKNADLKKDDNLLILGFGAMGSVIFKIAQLICNNIIIADTNDYKLEIAKKENAKYTINILNENLTDKINQYTKGYGTNISIDSACTNESLSTLLNVTRKNGRIITLAVSTKNIEINPFLITSKELTIKGSRIQNQMFNKAISLVNENKINLNNYVSHTFNINDIKEAFNLINSKDKSIRKVVITFN